MPSINKVVYGNRTLLDLTSDTVTAGTMLSGTTAHSASGDSITGTFAVEANKAVTVTENTVITPSSGNNAMAQVTVTVDKTKHYYATITKTGRTSYAYVVYPSSTGTTYYTAGDKFEIQAGQTIYMYANGSRTYGQILVNDEVVAGASASGEASYEYTVKKCDVEISLTYGNPSLVELTETASTLNITTNGEYDVSEYDIASVNVAGGITITEEANTTGTTAVVSGGGSSLTQHSIYFEFSDSTDTTIPVYYDDALLSTMITSYNPTTYGQKTVTLAQLDGVTWYERPTESWETIFDGSTDLIDDDPYPYWWIGSLSNVNITVGSVWKITINNTVYSNITATDQGAYGAMIGNPLYVTGTDDGSGLPFDFFNAGWGAWSGGADFPATSYQLKIERRVLV